MEGCLPLAEFILGRYYYTTTVLLLPPPLEGHVVSKTLSICFRSQRFEGNQQGGPSYPVHPILYTEAYATRGAVGWCQFLLYRIIVQGYSCTTTP